VGQIIFITGTDTGVGKTLLTGLLLAHLRTQGIHALAMKPFCVGGRRDAELFYELQDREVSLGKVNPYHFRQPLAPYVAARDEGKSIDADEAMKLIREMATQCELLLVEGAGGIFVPVSSDCMVADLISQLHCPVILAARNKLGVINHSILAVRALKSLRIRRLTVVLMGTRKTDLSARSNCGVLKELLQECPVLSIPFVNENTRRPAVIRKRAGLLKKVLAHLSELSIVRHSFRQPERKRRVGCG